MLLRTLRLPGLTARIEADDGLELDDTLALMPGARLRRGAGPADLRLRVSGDPPYVEVAGGVRREVSGPALLTGAIEDVLCQALIDRTTDRLLLHAGAAALDGRAVVYAAPSQGGKTTLTLSLLSRGWTCLSDDIVPVAAATAVAFPFPRLLHLRQPTLDLLPGIGACLKVVAPGRDASGQPVLLAAPLLPPPRDGAALAAVVILERGRGEAGRVKRLGPAVASVSLLDHVLNGGTLAGRAFDLAVQLATRVPCYTLALGSPAQSAAALESLLRPPQPGPTGGRVVAPVAS